MINFFNLQTNIGPILLSINPYHDVGNPLTLSSTRTMNISEQLKKIVHEAVRQQAETGYPQAIILSGNSYNLLLLIILGMHICGFRCFWIWKNSLFYAFAASVVCCGRRWARNGCFQTFSCSIYSFEITWIS